MKDVVLIPHWERPEMLHYCLAHLAKADGVDATEIWVLWDAHIGYHHHENPQTYEVVRQFPQLDIKVVCRKPHAYHGNSFNVLSGMRDAFETGTQNVFLVEDDVMVAKDFFRWHRAVMQHGKWFCSIATQCTRRPDAPQSDDASKFFVTGSDYASLGVCLPRRSLGIIAPHACDAYYREQGTYVSQRFRNSRFGSSFWEQDGLILRIMGSCDGESAWPCVPRAWHSGFWGYNRRDRQTPWQGSGLFDKLRFLGDALSSPSEMKKLAGKWQDVFAPDETPREWSNLELAARLV